ncbi:MAG: energy transducer TonB [Candidatus Omnitrophica bacterium]|nr:energy transducer TonB [Candidatus Omnitrophota bacterium]
MVFLKDRNLNIAILISVLWHFLCIFSFNPVLLTGNIREHKTSISFLGDILESVIPGNEKPFTLASVSMEHRIDKLEPVKAGFINTRPEKKDFSYSLADNRGSLKLGVYRKKETARVNFSDFFIKGDAKDRIVMYKPDLDKVTALPSDFNSDFNASIEFRISKDGFVKYAECVASSGFPEIDQAAIRYVRKWQFVPNLEDDQEGIVRVSFK